MALVIHPLLPLAFLSLQTPGTDFHRFGPYEAGVPTPESVLGYAPGVRHTTYLEQESVVRAIASASTRVKYITFGKSVEGRPLRILAISSPENIEKLDKIQAAIGRLAQGDPNDVEPIFQSTPALVWINEGIHGNEPASFESGMWLLYNLAASNHPTITGALKEAVVILNPSYNPDGHERYVVWYNSLPRGSIRREAIEMSQPLGLHGRSNHYRFDLNRDRVSMSQVETRQEIAEFLKWNPQVYVDQHGQVEPYFFPPVAMAVNANVDRARYEKWTETLGKATASSFDEFGWGYYIRNVFDLYYPGYLDSWTTLAGSIGMTHETEGGLTLKEERSDESTVTLAQGMAKHFTSALAVISTSAANREGLLRSYAKFKADAVAGAGLGEKRYLVFQGEGADSLVSTLASHGIKFYPVGAGKRRGKGLWTGEVEAFGATESRPAWAVDLAQPQGALAKALLDPESDFEPEFAAEQRRRREEEKSGEENPGADPLEFYDMTAWNLVFAHGLDAWWAEGRPEEAASIPVDAPPADTRVGKVGWIARPSTKALLEAARLMAEDMRIQVTTDPMTLDGESYPTGSLIILRERNEATAAAKVRNSQAFQALNTSYPSEGRENPGFSARPLRKPDIGIVFGDIASATAYGSVWYTVEQVFDLPFTALHNRALGGDLSKYTCLVFPQGRYGPTSAELKAWIEGGGTAVVLGGGDWLMGEKGLLKLEAVKLDKDKSLGYVPGAMFRAKLDKRFSAAYGYERDEIAVPIEGTTFFKKKAEGGGVVTLGEGDKPKLLSGWIWPDETEKALAGTVWMHEEPVGRGRIVWFAQDPTDRAMWPGLHRLLLNSMLLG